MYIISCTLFLFFYLIFTYHTVKHFKNSNTITYVHVQYSLKLTVLMLNIFLGHYNNSNKHIIVYAFIKIRIYMHKCK